MIQRIRGITLLTALVALAALGVAAVARDAVSTSAKAFGALAVTTSAKSTSGETVLVNTGITGKSASGPWGGSVIVGPMAALAEGFNASASSVSFGDASKTASIAFTGKTAAGVKVDGVETVTVTDPVKHTGTVSLIATWASGRTVVLDKQPCSANVISP